MEILCCCDSFKESISSLELNLGFSNLCQDENNIMQCLPISDGGDGFLEVASQWFDSLESITEIVHDALMNKITCLWGWDEKSKTAVIEIAQASGLMQIELSKRDPWNSSSYGTGELIKAAIKKGAKKIIIGLGGSATNDGGIGMLEALGVKFYDENNNLLQKVRAKDLVKICDTNSSEMLSVFKSDFEKSFSNRFNFDFNPKKSVKIVVACDVKNPFIGKRGATYVFGPQKGADEKMLFDLENGMKNWSNVTSKKKGINLESMKSSGAAGGLGGALGAWCGAKLISGMEFLTQEVDLENRIANSDLIVTGEGKIDESSFDGKVVGHVLTLAKKYQKKVFLICGQCEIAKEKLIEAGMDKIIVLSDYVSVEKSIESPLEVISKLSLCKLYSEG